MSMKKCIKIVLFFSIGLFLASCTSQEDELKITNQQTTNVNEMSFTTSDISGVMDKLNELNSIYGISAYSCIRRSPSVPADLGTLPNISNWSLSDVGVSRGWLIAAADAIGALSGGSKGASIGGHFGPQGAAIGAIGGAIVGGVAASLIASQVEDTTNQYMAVIETPMIYNSLPGCMGNTYSTSNTIPVGMEIGSYHNILVAKILEDNPLSDLTSLNDVYDIVVDYLGDELGAYFNVEDLVDIQELLEDNKYEMLTIFQGNIDTLLYNQGLSHELEILKHYAYSVSSEESHFDIRSYTLSYISIINSAYQNEILSASSTFLINAYISTLESSKELWNLTTPDPYTSNVFILYSANDGWFVVNGVSDYESIIFSGQYEFVGFPVFVDGELTRVYIKDDFPYNEAYAGAYVGNLFSGGIFECEDANLYFQQTVDYVKGGRFDVQVVDGYNGSYRYIDFTDHVN